MIKIAFELDKNDVQKLAELMNDYQKETADYNANISHIMACIIEYVYVSKIIGIHNDLTYSTYKAKDHSKVVVDFLRK